MVRSVCLRYVLIFFIFMQVSHAETLSNSYHPDLVQSIIRDLSKSDYNEEIHSLSKIRLRSKKLAEFLNDQTVNHRPMFRILYYQQKKAMIPVVQGILSLKLNPQIRLQLLHFLISEEIKSNGVLRLYLNGQLKHLLLTQNYEEKEIALQAFDYLKMFSNSDGLINNESFAKGIISEHQVEASIWDAEDIIEKSPIFELRKKATNYLREQRKDPIDVAWINQSIQRIQSGQSLKSYRSVWWELIHLLNHQNSALTSTAQLKSFSAEVNELFQLLKNDEIIHRIATHSLDRNVIFDFLFEIGRHRDLQETSITRNAQLTAYSILQQVLQYTHRHANTQIDLIHDMFHYFSANVQFDADLQEEVLSLLMAKILKNQNLNYMKAEDQRRISRLLLKILYWQIDLITNNLSNDEQKRTIGFSLKSVDHLLNRLSQLKYYDPRESVKVGDAFDQLVKKTMHQPSMGSQVEKSIHEFLNFPFLINLKKTDGEWYFKQLLNEQVSLQKNPSESPSQKLIFEKSVPLFQRLRPAVNNKNNCAKVFKL